MATKGKATAANLKARLLAIVNDPRRYDYDTRHAIAAALEDKNLNDRQRAAMCARAEAGEPVEHPLFDSFEEDYRTDAHNIIRFIESGLPDWLLQMTCQTIHKVANVHNIQVVPHDADGNFSARALANLLRVSRMFQFDDIPEPSLAEHISGVLNHPDIPTRIYNALAEAVGEYTVRDEVQNRHEVIHIALELAAEKEGGTR